MAGCNALVETAGERCFSCALTRTRPADADTIGFSHLAAAEAAKRRLLFELAEFGLPIKPEKVTIDINLIASTTTTMGLKIYAQMDKLEYEKGIKVSDQQLATVDIDRHDFHGDWNYTINHH